MKPLTLAFLALPVLLMAETPPVEFEPVFGLGVTGLLDDPVDFELKDGIGETSDQVLLVKTASRTRATGIVGMIIRPECGNFVQRFGLLLSATFSQTEGSEQTTGVLFGLSFRIMRDVNLFGGWSRKRGEELSYGFSRAAGQFVADNATNTTLQQLYGKNQLVVNPSSKSQLRSYDGFRISQNFKRDYFAGSPINASHNSAVVFGVAIPLKALKGLMGE